MNEKELLKIINKMDKQGKKKYILKNGIFPSIILVFIQLLLQIFFGKVLDNISFSTYIFSEQFVELVILCLIVFIPTGFLYALFLWKHYHKKKEKLFYNPQTK